MVDITVIAQARYSATRLPGKVLKELKGKTVLAHIITRVMKSRNINGTPKLIIATSDRECDNAVADEAEKAGAAVFRGSEEDVLSRFYGAAAKYNAKHILRLCCDNPFVDYGIIDATIDLYSTKCYDYIRNENVPIGLGVEIFSFEILEDAYLNAAEEYQREHVTPYIREHSKNTGAYAYERDYSKYRLTLDTPEDWRLTNELYDLLYSGQHDFGIEDVVGILNEKKELFEINKNIVQKKVRD